MRISMKVNPATPGFPRKNNGGGWPSYRSSKSTAVTNREADARVSAPALPINQPALITIRGNRIYPGLVRPPLSSTLISASIQMADKKMTADSRNRPRRSRNSENKIGQPVAAKSIVIACFRTTKNGTDTVITSPTQIGIVYSARIDTGPLYKVGNVVWSPGPGYTQDDFARDNELHPGTVPREAALTETRKAILAAFHKQGYVNAQLLVKTDLDDTAGTVNYIFAVNTGEFYKLNKITTVGLTPLAKKEFDDNFALKPGQPFNEDYVTNFLVNNPSLKALSGYGFNYQTDSNPETHTVDLTLTFTRAQ